MENNPSDFSKYLFFQIDLNQINHASHRLPREENEWKTEHVDDLNREKDVMKNLCGETFTRQHVTIYCNFINLFLTISLSPSKTNRWTHLR